MLIEGIFAAVTTPFYLDERVYFRKIEANMAHYSLVCWREWWSSAPQARQSCSTMPNPATCCVWLLEQRPPRRSSSPVWAAKSVKATVELAEAAAQYQYDAVLVRPPSYFAGQMSSAAVLHYFRCVSDRSPLPVILYNIPKFVPNQITIEAVAELARHSNIVAMKDSSGNVERIHAAVAATANAPRRTVLVTQVFEAVTSRMLVRSTREAGGNFVAVGDLSGSAAVATAPPVVKTRSREVGFQILTGSERSTLASLQAGASGAILAFAAFAPQACQEVYQAWRDHDMALAEEKQQRIMAAGSRIVGGLGIPGIKYACDFNGYYGGGARAPFLPLTAGDRAEVEGLLTEIRN